MNFSLKKPGSKIGFSVKKKASAVKKNDLFGAEEKTETKTQISSVQDIEQKKEEPLVIQPVVKASGWEARRKQRQEEKKLEESPKLEFGLNKQNKTTASQPSSRSVPLITQETEDGEAPTLSSYEKMPVEKFGEAMLRGMGWNGSKAGSRPSNSKPRIPYLGLGAKPSPAQEDRSIRQDTTYVPVVRRSESSQSQERSRSRSPTRALEYRER
ncbi:hypothetical protein OGAPHI_000978 [Ogataea philodendri]|uniref:Pre-mRNA-splicing factor n=1 Tax=Ogataea philodendri TaxID=1378263 RepID=A0A9P8PDW5_9ASCO|nr:uncharacterized protein OGAPHI_000978 [Ogataea philodendri]KAH3670463.1 hypothetical protein OGAPHI_000978 [Ogataea philodendri]